MNDTVILITGSRKGIGRYLAGYYVGMKCKVIGLSRDESDLSSEFYEHFCVDVGDEQQVKRIFGEIRKKYEKLDVVLNCAGIHPLASFFALIPTDFIEKTYRTNVFGLMNVCRESVKMMMKKKSGRIINFSSMAVKHEIQGDAVYASTKAAVNTFTRVLAKEINKSGITCNALAPAAILTDMSQNLDQSVLNEVLSRNAIKNYGNMEDVSNTVDWLIKRESEAITGQVIYLGGV